MTKVIRLNASTSFNQRWLQAEKYAHEENTRDALKIFEQLAGEGYAEAYVEIGNIYEKVSEHKNLEYLALSRAWYMRAIEEIEDPYGYIGLARLAISGYKAAGEISDAIHFLEVACNKENPVAMITLGSLFHSGKIIHKDFSRAEKLYETAMGFGYVLPIIYLSKLRFEEGCYLQSLTLKWNALLKKYKLKREDPSDPRLWNCG